MSLLHILWNMSADAEIWSADTFIWSINADVWSPEIGQWSLDTDSWSSIEFEFFFYFMYFCSLSSGPSYDNGVENYTALCVMIELILHNTS